MKIVSQEEQDEAFGSAMNKGIQGFVKYSLVSSLLMFGIDKFGSQNIRKIIDGPRKFFIVLYAGCVGLCLGAEFQLIDYSAEQNKKLAPWMDEKVDVGELDKEKHLLKRRSTLTK